jgi:hypothetical protein
MRLLTVVFLISIFSCKGPHEASKNKLVDNETVLTFPPGPNNPRNSEGDFITLKNGRILYMYTHFTGTSYMDDAPAYLASRFSDDNGKTWSKTDEIVLQHEDKKNLMSVSLLRLNNGEIAMFFLRKNSTWDCIPYVQFSTDEAKTWSKPVKCITDRKGYFVVNNNRIIQLKNGRLLMPVSQHMVKEGSEWDKNSEMGHLYGYYSDDNGRSWKSGMEVPNPTNALHQEPGVVQLSNGQIMMIIRSNTGVQQKSYSADNGVTWSPSERSNIYSPISPASVAATASSGELVLVWNNNNGDNPIIKGKRTPLNVAISKDDGKTWENMKFIEDNPKGSYCYTAIHFTKKNILLGYFDWATRQITIKRLNRDWVYN